MAYGYCTPCKYSATRASVGSRTSANVAMYGYLGLYVASGTLNTTCHERYGSSMTLSKSIEIENKCDKRLKRHIYSKNEAKMIFPTPPCVMMADYFLREYLAMQVLSGTCKSASRCCCVIGCGWRRRNIGSIINKPPWSQPPMRSVRCYPRLLHFGPGQLTRDGIWPNFMSSCMSRMT